MLIKKTTIARYRYKGDSDFYRTGEDYYLTVEEKRILFRKYVKVTCRHGYEGKQYPFLPIITYKDKAAFDEEWSLI